MTNPKNPPAIFFIPPGMAILLVKCDFSYSCAAADKISTDLRARAVSRRQLSYLFMFGVAWNTHLLIDMHRMVVVVNSGS